ncbi:MAG: BspA family leucine-rich repeat surface protein, partial [Spirochaetales bacterium]|nr:BspA family leucine-rich repeat surface protein [Spirochaetales bacterium]
MKKLSLALIAVSLLLSCSNKPLTRAKLIKKIERGEDVTEVNVSEITNMDWLFKNNSEFNQDISGWDVSNVTSMYSMFWGATSFDQDLSGWDVSRVTDYRKFVSHNEENLSALGEENMPPFVPMKVNDTMLRNMVQEGEDVTEVDVSGVTDMSRIFEGASAFNQDISGWDVSRVTDMSSMFEGATAFNQDISGWDVSHVEDMSSMFLRASSFDQD